MAPYATTKLSSRGQVVIPEEIRNNLGLSEGDTVILKTITELVIMDSFGACGGSTILGA